MKTYAYPCKVKYLWHNYLWPPIPWHRKAMDKEIIKAMATKFSEIFAIIMLKKHRKFCMRGLTYLAATPTFQKSFRSFWVTLYINQDTSCTLNECSTVKNKLENFQAL